jgi:multidrug efflux pump subunit AcrA (membrane-fusion protein)
MAGLVAVRQNRATDFYFPGMQLPDIHEGDTLRPGIPVADILDLSELEVLARVGELDRANLHEGQEVSITLDAVPDQKFRGTIKTMSGMASSAVFSGDPAKKFDVVFGIDMKQLMTTLGASAEQIRQVMETAARNAAHPPAKAAAFVLPDAPIPVAPGTPSAAPAKKSRAKDDDLSAFVNASNVFGTDEERAGAKLPPPPEEDSQLSVLLRPGLLADVEIFVEKIPNAISVPNQAVLEKDGRQFVYVQENGRFEPRFIKISRRSEAVTVIADNLKAGEVVSLGDPFAKNDSDSSKKNGTVNMPPSNGGAK